MGLSSSGRDSPYNLALCRQIINEVSKVPTMDTFRGLLKTHHVELREIIQSGTDRQLGKYQRMHSSVVDQICLATVEDIPHVGVIGGVSVAFEVRGTLYEKVIQLLPEEGQSLNSKAEKLRFSIMEVFDIPPDTHMAAWVREASLRALERSIDEKSHSGHADIRIVNGDMYMLTIRFLPAEPAGEPDNSPTALHQAALRADAGLVQGEFTSDIVNDDYGNQLFHGLLLVPDCGFEVHSPDSLQVSLVTDDYVLTVNSGTAETIQTHEWDLLTRTFSGDLGVFPAYNADGRTRSLSRFSQLGGAIQGAVRTGSKVVVAHTARKDAVFIVNPVPSTRALDAHRSSISLPLTNGWL